MKLNKIIIILISFLIISQKTLAESTVSIIYKINQEIITSIDIENEEAYLISLNNQLEDIDKKKRYLLAKNSILREYIKRIEISKYFILDQKDPIIEKIINDFIIKLNLENRSAFEEHLANYNLTIDDIKKKIEIETIWNQLIYKKYSNQLKIDEKKFEEKIKNQKNLKTLFSLSEIVFNKSSDQRLDDKVDIINQSITEIGFKNTANIYSISDSAKFGGDIGWIDKKNLSKNILTALEQINTNEHTAPIPITNGFLILKLKEIKSEESKINFDEELDKMIRYETDNQLNTYSKIYYNKIKINTIINEL
jgi:peptidyl-prolyl cis-trans isomerase SurA